MEEQKKDWSVGKPRSEAGYERMESFLNTDVSGSSLDNFSVFASAHESHKAHKVRKKNRLR